MCKVQYNSKNNLKAGSGLPVRINLSVGVEKQFSFSREKDKIIKILASSNRPDLIMDLSLMKNNEELWEFIRERFDGPIGVVPHYIIFDKKYGIKEIDLLKRIENLFANGVNFITVHCTPSIKIYEYSKKYRLIPITSRGGGIVLHDMIINKRKKNIYEILFNDICNLAKQYGVVINLGTTFRAGCVVDGFDKVAKMELNKQYKFYNVAKSYGVDVVLEGPGHLLMNEIYDYWNSVKNFKVPLMPLGPIVTDLYDDFDHISASIGASYLMMLARGGIINVITSVEHKGGVPNFKHLLEGLKFANLAAQAASATFCPTAYFQEMQIAIKRSTMKSCLFQARRSGCSRCGELCPLIISG